MNDACRSFQSLWLERALDPGAAQERDEHLDRCEACQAWVGEVHAQITALGQLEELKAPPELDELVFPLPAEPDLAAEGADEPPFLQALRDLPQLKAPSVLDRLVEEELRHPEEARARRFVGDLEPQEVPAVLERRVFRLFPPARARRRLTAPIAVAAAAALALWLGFSGVFQGASERERPFVVHHGRPETVHALAAGLAEGWSGGHQVAEEAR